MRVENVIILMFVVAAIVALIARRIRTPYTVALVVAGLALGSLHAFELPHLTKELLFTVFLPGLLFEAAFHIHFTDFWSNRRIIASLAVPGVVGAVALTAAFLTPVVTALDLVPGFTWHHALVFGALIAATDPIAVIALFKTLGVPRRLALLVEGESLLNDGTAIVLFTLVLRYVMGGTVSPLGLVIDFISIVGVGLLIGAGVGLAASYVIKQIDEPMLEITITTIAAYGSFIIAEQFHFSGVIATVVAGLFCGNYGARTGMAPTTRIAVETFWEYIAFALNSIVFLLIGFEVRVSALLESWQAILFAYLAVIIARAFVVAIVGVAFRKSHERLPRGWATVLTWGGLRGGLSMVLALGLPLTFAYRDFVITMTFGVIILSILVQGLSMSPLLRRLGVVRTQEARLAFERLRSELQVVDAALGALGTMTRARLTSPEVATSIREEYEHRARAAESAIERLQLEHNDLRDEENERTRRHLLFVEKEHLLEARRSGIIGEEAYMTLVANADARLLDLESEPAEENKPADDQPSDARA